MPARAVLAVVGRALLALSLAVAVQQVTGLPTAHAEGPVVIISSPPVPDDPGAGVVTAVYASGTITVDNPGGTSAPTQQCAAFPVGTDTFCLGTSDRLVYPGGVLDPGTITVSGASSLPLDLPGTGMDWIIDEAVSAVAEDHGLEADDLVRAYARPEIRAYVALRLRTILDKKLYGQPMTAQEEAAYAELTSLQKARSATAAQRALHEYQRWSANPCGYDTPSPPAGSGLPAVPNPVDTPANCGASSGLANAFKFTRGTPPASTFDTWASYRNPSPMMAAAGDKAFRSMSTAQISALVLLAGTGLALAAGTVTGVAMFAYLSAAVVTATPWMLSMGVTPTAVPVAVASVAGAAIAVAVVVLAIVIAAVSIYQFVEDLKPAQELRQRVAAAGSNDDPFGIEAAAPDYAGLDFAIREEPAAKPVASIHASGFVQQLQASVNEWMMFNARGELRPDPTSGYTATGPGESDWRFVEGDLRRDRVVLLARAGEADIDGHPISGHRVFFSRGWLMVSSFRTDLQTWSASVPRLNVRFLDTGGRPSLMTVASSREEGGPRALKFVTTRGNSAGDDIVATASDTWTYRGSGGAQRTVSLATTAPVLPVANVLPSVQGQLVADNLVELRANLSTDAPFGGTYTWTIKRYDDAGVAHDVAPPGGNLVGFQKRLPVPGKYRAAVSYQPPSGPAVSGTVEFVIAPPQPEVMTAAIRDDRLLDGKLFLDLRMLQNTDGDTFGVDIDWARQADGTTVTQHYDVQCEDAGFDTCDTGSLIVPASAPINANWSASPSYRIPDDIDYLPFVTVRVTNGYGNTVTRVFPITGDNRPRYVDRTPDVTMAVGTFSRVDVTEVVPSALLIESQDLTFLPYGEEISAQLPAGIGPDLQKRGDRWFLQLRGAPNADDIGSYTFAFPFEQEPNGAGFKPSPAIVTLEVAASTEPGYRALLRRVPYQLSDRVYRNRYPDYAIQVAQTLAPADTGFAPFTGVVHCVLTAGPTTVFDKPCQDGSDFPWPAERYSEPLVASVYVTSESQPISADGASSTSLITSFTEPTLTVKPAKPADLAQDFSLAVRDNAFGLLRVPTPFSDSDYAVTCRRDGGRAAPCLNSGKLSLARTPGRHTLAVTVEAPDGTSTVETVVWRVETPARTLDLDVPRASQQAGSLMRVSLTRMLPGESWSLRVGGKVVKRGTADKDGTAEPQVRIPAALEPGTYSVTLRGATAQRVARGAVRVVA